MTGLVLGNDTRLSGGGGRLTLGSGQDQHVTLNVGEITRTVGSSIDFSTVSNGAGIATINTTTQNNSAGILGGYATFQGNDWAVNDGSGSIARLAASSYTTNFGSGLHTSLAGNTAITSGGATTHSLRITGGSTITFNATTPGSLILETVAFSWLQVWATPPSVARPPVAPSRRRVENSLSISRAPPARSRSIPIYLQQTSPT
ncbi:hypothetical protein [Verrucomicrobium spinosum]|uniref:hypothetical protein n=1 Tax=Verrucomicrobium spinosum TaxID=2736 RepID=UPI00210ACF02|nr:hypothetical protein [Verrucomicrobium spinosum]